MSIYENEYLHGSNWIVNVPKWLASYHFSRKSTNQLTQIPIGLTNTENVLCMEELTFLTWSTKLLSVEYWTEFTKAKLTSILEEREEKKRIVPLVSV